MNKLLLSLVLLFNCLAGTSLVAVGTRPLYLDIYPEVEQTLIGTEIFRGDRHGQFEGDYVADLSDGSAWKVHPEDREVYAGWHVGDTLRAKVRTDFYWFKREHKFWLYNMTRGESVKAMIIQHKGYFHELKIVSTDSYAKSTHTVEVLTTVRDFNTGRERLVTTYKTEPCDFRKVLRLSDGSFWVIKEKFDLFSLGTTVYIGAQGSSTNFYDFVFITGDEREADWTYARPQR